MNLVYDANVWAYGSIRGWLKLDGSSVVTNAFEALVTLVAQAKQTGRAITFREEADGMVYEIYLW